MKKALALALVLVMVLALVPFGIFADLEKDGDVYLIKTAEDLVAFKNMVNEAGANTRFDAKLVNDIDMSGVTDWTPIGNHKLPNGSTENDGYLGIFDGNGKTISNLHVTVSAANGDEGKRYSEALLFGVLANGGGVNAEVKNFTLKDSSITVNAADDTKVYVGGICNNINRAKIIGVTLDNVDIKVTGKASEGYVGLIAQAGTWDPNLIDGCTIKSNCSITTSSANLKAALVCAFSDRNTLKILNCSVAGTIDAPKGAKVAAYCITSWTPMELAGTTNKSKLNEFGGEYSYMAKSESDVDGKILNDKINVESVTAEGLGFWGDGAGVNMFKGPAFGKDALEGGDANKVKMGGGYSADTATVITFATTEKVRVGSYALVTGFDSGNYPVRDPESWTLYGSTDGSNWVKIDQVTFSGILPLNSMGFVYEVDKVEAYDHFKLEVTRCCRDNNCLQLDSLVLIEAAPEPLKKGATVDGGVWNVSGNTYTLTETRERNHTGFNTYVLGDSSKKVTLKYEFIIGGTNTDNFGGDVGYLFAVEDLNGDGKIYEGDDNYYLVDLQKGGTVGIEKNIHGWTDWAITSEKVGEVGDKVTLEVTYDPSAHTIVVKANGEEVLNWKDENWKNAAPLTGTGYALASKQTAGSVITKAAAPAPVHTGDIAIALVVIAVIALAGVAVVIAKRKSYAE